MLILSCTSQKKLMEKYAIEGSCESKIRSVQLSPGQKLWSTVKETSGKSASFMITGLGYSTDVLLSFSGGIVGGVVICSPLIALDIAASKNGGSGHTASGQCVGDIGGEIIKATNPNLGPLASEKTRGWRCPEMDPIAESLFVVSSCYKENGEMDLARKQLLRMKESKQFYACLSEEMKERIEKTLAQ